MSDRLRPISPREIRDFVKDRLPDSPFTAALVDPFLGITDGASLVVADVKLPGRDWQVYYAGMPNIRDVQAGIFLHFNRGLPTRAGHQDTDRSVGVLKVQYYIDEIKPFSERALRDGWQAPNQYKLTVVGEDATHGRTRTGFLRSLTVPELHLLINPTYAPTRDWMWGHAIPYTLRSTTFLDQVAANTSLAREEA